MTARPDVPPPLLHWSDAAYHWDHYGPPLRPAADDVAAMAQFVAALAPRREGRPLRALLLGVTPEIATMRWPAGTQLAAVDRSQAMLDHVWPGDVVGSRSAQRADWFDLPWDAGGCDVVIGDGIFAILDWPRQYRALVAAIRRGLAADGVFVTRHFLQAEHREAPEAVLADLAAGRIGSFHAFKLRLAMAMQSSADAGVRMGDIHDAWESAGIDREALLARTGWSAQSLETIRPWAHKDARLAFPGADAMEAMMREERFERARQHIGGGELGRRCPVVAYRPGAQR